MSAIGFVTMFLALGCDAGAIRGVHWETDPQAAMSKAVLSRQPVLIFFTTPGCTPCHKMLYEAFGPGNTAAYVMSKTVPLYVYDETGRNALSVRYNVTTFPTLVLTTSGGATIGTHTGYLSPKQVTAFIGDHTR